MDTRTRDLEAKIKEQLELFLIDKTKKIKPNFWLINETNILNRINPLINNLRLKPFIEKYNKYLKIYYFNNIKSHEDIKMHLTDIYKQENNQFKMQISLGYVFDNNTAEIISVCEPFQHFYFDEPTLIKSYAEIENIINNYLRGSVIDDNSRQNLPYTQTKFIGIYSMAVKITRLDSRLSVQRPAQLPSAIKKVS